MFLNNTNFEYQLKYENDEDITTHAIPPNYYCSFKKPLSTPSKPISEMIWKLGIEIYNSE